MDTVTADCDTVFHCPVDREDIRICADDDQLQVVWQRAGVDAYRLGGALGQTFNVRHSQSAQIIRNTLSWQHLGSRYTAFHYVDESRPEALEAIGITVITGDHRRTLSCNDNAFSDMARLRPLPQNDAADTPSKQESSATTVPDSRESQ